MIYKSGRYTKEDRSQGVKKKRRGGKGRLRKRSRSHGREGRRGGCCRERKGRRLRDGERRKPVGEKEM